MNFENLFNGALEYTRDAFAGRWARWLIFVLLGLPLPLAMTIFKYTVDLDSLIAGGTFHPEQVPWVPIAVFFLVGILTSFVIGGYSVRVYRGTVPAPDFTGWASLFVDGIKLDIVALVWVLPAIIVLLAELAMTFGLIASGNTGFIILAILLIPVELILVIIAILFLIPGTIRFARTGSMTEGWNFTALREILRRIGWVNYFIVLLFYVVIAVVYSVVVSIPGMIPYVGWIVPVLLAPFLTVFTARYFTLVYSEGELLPETPPPAPDAPEA